ncbi:retrieval of early ER protein Rer1 [Jimgerdemannia flammicorona]|uniref:Protein RER1 n=1 Tax=Jimgerdemannia flammicorona TaxID=994334 RepID=A0A433DJR3_9FUNG|nr:retrieval of early ER protein Rer1 [Jimgerdemannia flammicorona]
MASSQSFDDSDTPTSQFMAQKTAFERSTFSPPITLSPTQQRWQHYLDEVTPYTTNRWIATGVLVVIYAIRVLVAQGWYIVTYALGIYLLNLFLAFLQPKFDPSLEMDIQESEVEEGPALPTKNDEEFRPFIRRLPEFKFWYSATRAIVIAFFCTLFSIFDVPVFWPILLVYFCILFYITMKRQIKHMIKYRYVPFNVGKKSYAKNNK